MELTKKEIEVLKIIASGCSVEVAGTRMSPPRGPDTVRFHLLNVYRKMGVHKRLHAVRRAIEMGVVE